MENEALKALEKRVKDLEDQNGGLTFPLNPQTKGAVENAIFAIIQANVFKGGLPVYTTARDITIDIPRHGEIWLEDVSGPTRRICAYIVALTTGVGTKYTVAIT